MKNNPKYPTTYYRHRMRGKKSTGPCDVGNNSYVKQYKTGVAVMVGENSMSLLPMNQSLADNFDFLTSRLCAPTGLLERRTIHQKISSTNI